MPARRRTAPTPTQRTQWSDERQAKLAELHTRIVEQVATLTDADQWRAWLSFATNFHSYSFHNTIAIWMQRPDATWVAGIKRWNSLGRTVRKGERGIAILAPITAKTASTTEPDPVSTQPPPTQPAPASAGSGGQPGVMRPTGVQVAAFIEPALNRLDAGEAPPTGRLLRGFRIVTVFDISQTDGPPIDAPARPRRSDVDVALLTGQAPAGVWDAFVHVATDHGYRIERGDCGGPNGFICWAEHLIKVRDDVDDAQAVKTLIHELGHLLLHDPGDFIDGSTLRCRGEQEVEAESIAFLTAAHVGLDTSEYTFGYVTGWAEEAARVTGKAPHDIVQATGVRVVRAAAALTTAVDDALGQGEPPVADTLAQHVAEGTRAAAKIRQAAHAALATAPTIQPGPFHPPSPAARAFPPPAPPGPAASAAPAPASAHAATGNHRHR